jgi:hypothetical protein
LTRALRVPADTAALARLRSAGFLDYEAPDGGSDDTIPGVSPTTRVVVLGTADPAVPDRTLALPLLRAITADRDDQVAPATLVVAARPPADAPPDAPPGIVTQVREDRALAPRLSSVDDVDEFAGRLAVILALADLGAGRTGHYGVGPGAQRLLPAPPE